MTFGNAISTCMSKYATFTGRATRSEYWWFYLFTLLVQWGGSIVSAITMSNNEIASGLFDMILSLAFLIPLLAAGTRRLHDNGRSGWWQLIALTGVGIIVLIIWWASEGSKEANNYGEPFSDIPEGSQV